MNQNRFDAGTRLLTDGPSRRGLLSALASVGLGAGFMRLPDVGQAKKKRKKRKKPPTPVVNEFGCLDVGQPCRGNSALCCSGVCQGKKPKKGKADKRVCAAHHAGDCTLQRNYCVVDPTPVLSLCDLPADTAFCMVTTGNAPFCASLLGFDEGVHCHACAKDADCLALGFPSGSSCALVGGDLACAGLCASGMACVSFKNDEPLILPHGNA